MAIEYQQIIFCLFQIIKLYWHLSNMQQIQFDRTNNFKFRIEFIYCLNKLWNKQYDISKQCFCLPVWHVPELSGICQNCLAYARIVWHVPDWKTKTLIDNVLIFLPQLFKTINKFCSQLASFVLQNWSHYSRVEDQSGIYYPCQYAFILNKKKQKNSLQKCWVKYLILFYPTLFHSSLQTKVEPFRSIWRAKDIMFKILSPDTSGECETYNSVKKC